jgi:hypothetical protein
MVFTAGTSENNTVPANTAGGVQVNQSSGYNTFISSDFEGSSSGLDISDNGGNNSWQQIVASSKHSDLSKCA